MNGKTPTNPQPVLKINNSLITNPLQVANIFADHYKSISDRKETNLPKTTYHPRKQKNQEYNKEFTMKELRTAITKSKKTSPGPDEIHNEMLKNLPNSMLLLLLSTFNWFWRSGSIPDQWKSANVIPILKAGKDPFSPASYRPISLTNTLCKIYEKIVNDKLLWYLEDNKLLNPKQFAFRKNKNTVDPITIFTTDVLNGFAQKKITMATFFDLEKAYDTINRKSIIDETKKLGLQGNLLDFIAEFLNCRTFKVNNKGTYSNSRNTVNGIPQGSVISVTLFNIGINGVLKELPSNINGSLYADDLMIYITTRTTRNAARQMQQGINEVNRFVTSKGLNISETKTAVIVFKKRNKCNEEPPQLFLHGKTIQLKTNIRFLGITLDTKLNFVSHIKELASRAKRSLNLIKIASAHNWGADKTTLLRLYWALIRSVMDYGSTVYSLGNQSALKLLDSVHNEALRICMGAFRSLPVTALCVEAEEPPLESRRLEQGIKYYTRISSLLDLKESNITNDQLDDVFLENDKLRRPFGVYIRNHITQNFQNYDIKTTPLQKIPPWELQNIRTCIKGAKYPKTALDILQRNYYLEHEEIYHRNCLSIYTDGSTTQSLTVTALLEQWNINRIYT